MRAALRAARAVLRQEPESWLAYLHGRQLENLPHLTRTPPRQVGAWRRVLLALRYMVRETRPGAGPAGQARYLFYAGSANQAHALEGTLAALRRRGEHTVALGHGNAGEAFPFRPFSISDLLGGLWLLVGRLPALWRQTREAHPLTRAWYFDLLCRCPILLVHFHRLLRRHRPAVVVTSNDHSVDNRCLLAMAHHLGIATVYCQHASVSPLFPALRVNVALLDGAAALDIYRRCAANRPPGPSDAPRPCVFLTGQKKALPARASGAGIGIAVNTLDDTARVRALLEALRGWPVILRWHPRQAKEQVADFKRILADTGGAFSDPAEQPVGDFLARLRVLIAGDSSIHLEAALAGVRPLYYPITPADTDDYYGYVAVGVADRARSLDELVAWLNRDPRSPTVDGDSPVRYYSHTFGTEWEGREGELAADILQTMPDADRYPDLFGYQGPLRP